MLCREAILIKRHSTGAFVMPLCCRSWGCDYCRPDRKRTVVRQAARGKPNTLITITCDPALYQTKENRARELVIAWRDFVRHAKTEYGYDSIPYFAVFEATQKGEPHLHILCRVKWIPQKDLSDYMSSKMGAPVCDIRRCNSSRSAARYVSKYIGKKPGKFGTCKRYWQTKDYAEPSDHEPHAHTRVIGTWRIEEQSLHDCLIHAAIRGKYVTWTGNLYSIQHEHPKQLE